MTNSDTQVAVIGCGWLGFPLAKQLLQCGYPVCGTSRAENKLSQLSEAGIDPVPLDIYTPQTQSINTLKTCDTWIICIAAGRRNANFEQYVKAVYAMMDHAVASNTKHVIFVSTTSVYGNQAGSVNEDTLVQPTTDSGKAHVLIENYLRTVMPDKYSIVRCAGLVDRERHPVRTLSKKGTLSAPTRPVNLIHKRDVIEALLILVSKGPLKDGTFLLASPKHPTREDYYTWAAAQLSISPPAFLAASSVDEIDNKVIDAARTFKRLGLSLRYESPYEMLAE
ncbi:NAD(P)H-binding protein [Alteromonas facilis]|uniref:NAD(P)H-binding protein n=1 Tax=Alteromonas facilis TaxID=2048004 RepID=UPI000C293600|nr:NAD(P)H-binding protein [Alteromonas facilis]